MGREDMIGRWKGVLFHIIKYLSCSLAKGKISKSTIDNDFYKLSNPEISSWRCQKCGHTRIDKVVIEGYLAIKFLPLIIVDLIENDELEKIVDLDNIVNCNEINKSRELILKQISEQKITLTNGNEWLRTCPKCQSKNILDL